MVASASFVPAHKSRAFCHCHRVPPPQLIPPCMTRSKHRGGSVGFEVPRHRFCTLSEFQSFISFVIPCNLTLRQISAAWYLRRCCRMFRPKRCYRMFRLCRGRGRRILCAGGGTGRGGRAIVCGHAWGQRSDSSTSTVDLLSVVVTTVN